ncbi:secreted RxLR effector protein 161-like [Ziziphus jujuba]|uniref:Secreted RxLR effector protein 161-like n=1 Tax=Ziziphus jujuba TaxID=326968 RepID=A0ABM4ADN8_ZIZJJ|nr:secreted RxLR effector protein 161-like [Ziziphus jujuba]
MDGARPSPSPMVSNKPLSLEEGDILSNPELYRSTIGALQYLTLTRPNISFTVNKLSQFVQAPTSLHWDACKRLLRYLKGTATHGLFIKSTMKLVVHGFSDSDWASDRTDRRSTSGYGIFLGSNLISWRSKKQQVVACSSTEAEYRALAHITSELCWLQNLIKELELQLPIPIVWTDSLSAAALAENPVLHQRTKHIEIDMHFVRDKVLEKSLQIRYVPTRDQVADVFTKSLGTSRFLYLKNKLGVVQTT